MARNIPGSGAQIEPIFNTVFGVKAVKVVEGGSEYTSSDPPRLTISGCGTPVRPALLYPIIDDDSGKIVHVRVLDTGSGYNPLRVSITPLQDTPTINTSFDVNRVWQGNSNSSTSGSFQIQNSDVTDRLRIVSDGDPKPSLITTDNLRAPGGSTVITDSTFDQTFIYRGGKDVPFSGDRLFQNNKSLGIMANGVLLHTPEWGAIGNAPAGFSIDTVNHDYIKTQDEFDGVIDNQKYYYQSNKLISQFAQSNGVFENGLQKVFTWNVKTEIDNILLNTVSIQENNGNTPIEVGITVSVVGGSGTGEIAKVVRNSQGLVERVYVRIARGVFEAGSRVLGSNGFYFTVSGDPRTFLNGFFYIDFGPEAHEFGDFIPGRYYFAPENIQVQRNYLIIWDQSDDSNRIPVEHPMRFSTTQDGSLNSGTLYYNSTGASQAPAADYENEYQAVFIMNADETNRIYYYCGNHRYMSGYEGDEGYLILNPEIENEEPENNYYISNFYQPGDASTIDYSRHVTGHSKIVGMSFDGYPIYGPYGYTSGTTVGRMTSSYRLKTGAEIDGNRATVNTVGSVTKTVTVSNDKFLIDGQSLSVLNLDRGKVYTFNLDDSSNDTKIFLFSETEDGWHSLNDNTQIGNTAYVYPSSNIKYYIDGSEVDYAGYLSGYTTATTRSVVYDVKVDAPTVLYVFSYSGNNAGYRSVQNGYVLGDFTQDYIYDDSQGILDEFNGIFTSTPEYPNGTYAYFMTENVSGVPVYPYAIGPKMYGEPFFEGDTLPDIQVQFPFGAEGEVFLDGDEVGFIKMTKNGDSYFGPTQAKILGGEGNGATVTPVVQTVTGLTLQDDGRSFSTPPNLIFEGGGGQGATGAAQIDTTGKLTNITIIDNGEFYQEAPYVLITGGGGLGAKGIARVSQGQVVGIDITNPGRGYTSPPNVIFQKLVNLKRITSNRQSLNSSTFFLTGVLKEMSSSDNTVYVKSTNAFPGSGSFIIDNETINYATKTDKSLGGLTRGVNFRYDQRIILDTSQNDGDGISTYQYKVGDTVIRQIENANNKIAKVYDWNPNNRELLVTFEVDELAFIDGGIPSTEDTIVQFDAGTAGSASSSFQPHNVIFSENTTITTLTVPIGALTNSDFEDDDELSGAGDGIPDLINTGTAYVNQISLDGGIYSSLYGVEETVGGQNTTLFQVGENIKDGSTPFKFAGVIESGALSEGRPHEALIEIQLDGPTGNGFNYQINETIVGSESGIVATVVSWDSPNYILTVRGIIPYDTGDVSKGLGGLLYEFSENSCVVDFIILDAGTNYTAPPTIVVEDIGDIQATGTVNMTVAGDQIASVTVTDGGYGIIPYIDNTYNSRPTVTVTNAGGDTTGNGGALQIISGGEKINGNGGASYRIKGIKYLTEIRS
jgi:hypothetical protein